MRARDFPKGGALGSWKESSGTSDFQAQYAAAYFDSIRQALKQYDPNHLYLGTRFERRVPDQGILAAAGKNCDVLTISILPLDSAESRPNPTPGELQKWHEASGLPILVGAHSLPLFTSRQVQTGVGEMGEMDRMEGYQGGLVLMASQPFVVGAHYSQYNDLPTAGRGRDGAQQAVGFVDVVDSAHADLGFGAQVGLSLYEMRSTAATPRPGKPAPSSH